MHNGYLVHDLSHSLDTLSHPLSRCQGIDCFCSTLLYGGHDGLFMNISSFLVLPKHRGRLPRHIYLNSTCHTSYLVSRITHRTIDNTIIRKCYTSALPLEMIEVQLSVMPSVVIEHVT